MFLAQHLQRGLECPGIARDHVGLVGAVDDPPRVEVCLAVSRAGTGEEVRKRLEWLDRKYQEEISNQGVKDHGKKVLYGAILVALFWFMFALVKDAAVAEVATQLRNQTEIRNKG